MSENMIQLGTDLYALRSDVVRIYRTNERPGGLVYVVMRQNDAFGGVSDVYRNTDWPLERVARVLGLSDGTAFHEMMED